MARDFVTLKLADDSEVGLGSDTGRSWVQPGPDTAPIWARSATDSVANWNSLKHKEDRQICKSENPQAPYNG